MMVTNWFYDYRYFRTHFLTKLWFIIDTENRENNSHWMFSKNTLSSSKNFLKLSSALFFCTTYGRHHYSDLIWASWRLNSPATRLIVQSLIVVNNCDKGNLKGPPYQLLSWESTAGRWVPITNGQWWEKLFHGLLTRYLKLLLCMWRECREPFPHHCGLAIPTCITARAHVPWCIAASLTSCFLWSRWREKRSRHSRCMHNPQFCVSGKRPMPWCFHVDNIMHVIAIAGTRHCVEV